MVNYNISADGKRIDTFPKGVLEIKDAMDYFMRLSNDATVHLHRLGFHRHMEHRREPNLPLPKSLSCWRYKQRRNSQFY